MAPTVLVTAGILILLQTLSIVRISKTLPILLIVIGIVMVLQRTSSTEGHIPLGYVQQPGMTPPPPTIPNDFPPDIPGPGAEGVNHG
jgi:hypothetical protein